MLNKILKDTKFFVIAIATVFAMPLMAQDVAQDIDEEDILIENISAEAVDMYEVEGTVFQQITDLEQQKVLMQLEKEKAQLDLELDRLAAEKIKLHMEIDTLAGRANEQAQQPAAAPQQDKIQTVTEDLEDTADEEADAKKSDKKASITNAEPETEINSMYKLVDIIGAGNQLQATLESLKNGQRKKVSVGKTLDEFTVKSISLDEGVVFQKGDAIETLNISKEM